MFNYNTSIKELKVNFKVWNINYYFKPKIWVVLNPSPFWIHNCLDSTDYDQGPCHFQEGPCMSVVVSMDIVLKVNSEK